MITILLLAQAATLGAEPEGIPTQLPFGELYPPEAVRKKWSGPLDLDLSIDDSGRVVGCKTAASSGHEILDATACKLVLGRLRYKPACDETGRRIAAGVFLQVNWTLPGQSLPPRYERAPDMLFEVKQLPGGGGETMEVLVRMVQEADGIPVSCVVSAPSPSPALDRAACKLAVPLAKMDPVFDAKSVSVRNLRVRRLAFKQAK